MTSRSPVPSISSNRSAVGTRAALHFDLIFRRLFVGPEAVNDPDYFRVVTGEAHPLGNIVIPGSRCSATLVSTAIAPLLQGDFPSAVIFTESASNAARRAVLDAGFTEEKPIPAMAIDIDRLKPTGLPAGYTCSRVGIGTEGDAWADTLAHGYGIPLKLAQWFSPARIKVDMSADAAVQFFSIQREDRTVATSLLFLADGLAGIYCVATLPEERGKGLGAHVTAEALRVAGRLGYHVGVLQSSTEGHRVYGRLGFEDVGNLPMFVRMPD